jgi:hypothetical protein
MDGYPEGHGVELGEILAPITLVNGYQMDMKAGSHANGPGCLAAQVIQRLKEEHGIGGIYMIVPDPAEHTDGWQEYEYYVHVNTVGKGFDATYEVHVEVSDTHNTIFNGDCAAFLKWAKKPPRNKEGEYKIVKPRKAKAPVYEDLRDALHHATVSVKFTKSDGTIRVMECTTDPARIPEDKMPAGTSKVADWRHDPKLYKVFDLEKSDWRSFRDERVIDWKVV